VLGLRPVADRCPSGRRALLTGTFGCIGDSGDFGVSLAVCGIAAR
jgi:hypothetical protein